MLLHGFGETGNIWKNQFDIFPGYRLIVPDLPGTGRSELSKDMSMEGLASAVKAVLEKETTEHPEGGQKAILVGHSMGGYVSLAFAEYYPELVDLLCLFHSSAFADSEEKKQTRQKGIGFIREHGPLEFLRTTIPNLYAPQTRRERPRLVEKHLEEAADFTGEALITYYESMMKRKDRSAILQKAPWPVLFILGRHDSAIPLEDGLKQTHLANVSYVHILEQSGHMGMIEETELSNQAINDFLADHKRP